MKNILLSILCICTTLCRAQAVQDTTAVLPPPAILMDMPRVRVVQDSSITLLMQEKEAGIVHGVKEMPGFRMQIFSDNTPGQAKTRALQIEEQFATLIDQPIYVISNPPFFKVRIGDFQTLEEANRYKENFLSDHPEMAGETYIVREERIQVKQ